MGVGELVGVTVAIGVGDVEIKGGSMGVTRIGPSTSYCMRTSIGPPVEGQVTDIEGPAVGGLEELAHRPEQRV